MQQRTAIAVAATTVGLAWSTMLAAVAVTGGSLFGLHGAGATRAIAAPVAATTTDTAAPRTPQVVTRTVYEEHRVVVRRPPASSGSGGRSTPVAPTAGVPTATAPATSSPRSAPPPSREPPTTSPAPTTTSPPTTPPQTATISTAAGTIDIRWTASALTIVAVHADPGYQYEISGGGTQYEVQLASATSQLKVELALRNGGVHYFVESDD